MPNMSSKPRPAPTPRQLHPYYEDEYSDGQRVPLRRGSQAAAAVLDAWAARAAERTRPDGK